MALCHWGCYAVGHTLQRERFFLLPMKLHRPHNKKQDRVECAKFEIWWPLRAYSRRVCPQCWKLNFVKLNARQLLASSLHGSCAHRSLDGGDDRPTRPVARSSIDHEQQELEYDIYLFTGGLVLPAPPPKCNCFFYCYFHKCKFCATTSCNITSIIELATIVQIFLKLLLQCNLWACRFHFSFGQCSCVCVRLLLL